MSRSDDFGLQIDFARRALLFGAHLAPAGLGDLSVRRELPPDVGFGSATMTSLSRGLGLSEYHCTDAPGETRVRMELFGDYFKFTFHLAADPGEVGIEGVRSPIFLSRMDSYILGPSVIGTQVIRPDTVTHELSLFADPAMVDSCFEDDGRHLPPVFKRALSRRLSEPFFLPGHATAAMGLAVRQMLTCGLRGALARTYLEAKITELITLRLAQVFEEPPPSRRLVLMHRDRELLHEARSILTERYTDPPTISELARAVAMNRTKLKAGFKELFGTTIFGFVRTQRMREAFELLLDGTCNVTEAANRVGYNSPGAFAAAFKAEYGFLPHRTRQLEF